MSVQVDYAVHFTSAWLAHEHRSDNLPQHARFTQDDFNRFAALSGDDNPIHVDPEFSARTKFGRTVAHGMLLYGVISGAVSATFSGRHATIAGLTISQPNVCG